jgi:hypothetical protein
VCAMCFVSTWVRINATIFLYNFLCAYLYALKSYAECGPSMTCLSSMRIPAKKNTYSGKIGKEFTMSRYECSRWIGNGVHVAP